MNPNRKKTEAYILKYVDKIAQGGQNKELYSNLFKSMSDKEFNNFMLGLKSGKVTLSIIVPHDKSVKVTVPNNIKIGKELGYDFFQQLIMTDDVTGDKYTTPNKYFVYRLPIKRVAQLVSKGIAIPKDSKHTDALTGQVSGASKAVSITMPEIQMLVGMGMDDVVLELLKFRGGDLGARNAMMNLLYQDGHVDKETLKSFSTGVEGTKTLKNYFLGAHIRSEGLDN